MATGTWSVTWSTCAACTRGSRGHVYVCVHVARVCTSVLRAHMARVSWLLRGPLHTLWLVGGVAPSLLRTEC